MQKLKRDNTWQSIIDDFGSDLSKDYYTELDTKKFIEHSDEFTCGFYSTELNFYIENLPEDEEIISNIPFFVDITEKLLFRGCPSSPSHYLINQLKKHFPNDTYNKNDLLHLINDQQPEWSEKTILGNSNDVNDNPALLFYRNLSKDLEDYSFVTNLIIPEYEIVNFCPQISKEINPLSRVDFFIPRVDLVIEIDGAQHADENQKEIDKVRDEALGNIDINTVRISSKSVRLRDKDYYAKISIIYDFLKKNKDINRLKKVFDEKQYLKESYHYTATAICRFQVVLLELIKSGFLKLNSKSWNLIVHSDVVSSFNWAKLACDDLFEWMLPIAQLGEEKLEKPKINIKLTNAPAKENSNELVIDFKLFKRFDDNKSNYIKVRNSYVNLYKWRSKDGKLTKEIQKDHSILKTKPDKLDIVKRFKSLPFSEKYNSLNKLLFQFFGYADFKDGQLSILNKIFDQGNTLGLLPTGGGKSLCFQLTSSLQLGCCIVICPIQALMRDHVDELDKLGFSGRSEFIMGGQDPQERELIYEKIRSGKTQFLFITPERFQVESFRKEIVILSNRNLISYIVIDEVHCLSEWGHSFRTSYLALANTLYSVIKINTPVISLTATASLAVLEDIKVELKLKDTDVVYKMDNSRKELNFNVINAGNNKFKKLEETVFKMIKKSYLSNNSAGIVFSPFVNNEYGSFNLEQTIKRVFPNIKTGLFSGKAPEKWISNNNKFKKRSDEFEIYKKKVQKEFKDNTIQLMFATKAFGMGINKKNIRFSVHFAMPESMEALYQEAGRTGRDGNNAENIVLFSEEKEAIPREITNKKTTTQELMIYQKGYQDKKGDFKRQIYFIANDNTIEDELSGCLNILEDLYRNKEGSASIYKGTDTESETNNKVEKNIYRLFQLGIVNDWTVNDFFQKNYQVKYSRLSDNEIAKNLIKHIEKYQLSISENKIQIEEIENILNSNDIKNKKEEFIKYLLQWNHENFLYNRRQSLKTLYDCCLDYKESGPDEFKRKIDAFFRVDSQTTDIGKFLESTYELAPKHLNEILIKDNKLIPHDQIEEIMYSLARWLESYSNNPWLDLLSSMCRLITNNFDDQDGKGRLVSFISVAKQETKTWKNTLENLLKFTSLLDEKEKLKFSEVLDPKIDNIDELILIHSYLQDNHTALTYIKNINNRLDKVF